MAGVSGCFRGIILDAEGKRHAIGRKLQNQRRDGCAAGAASIAVRWRPGHFPDGITFDASGDQKQKGPA